MIVNLPDELPVSLLFHKIPLDVCVCVCVCNSTGGVTQHNTFQYVDLIVH